MRIVHAQVNQERKTIVKFKRDGTGSVRKAKKVTFAIPEAKFPVTRLKTTISDKQFIEISTKSFKRLVANGPKPNKAYEKPKVPI